LARERQGADTRFRIHAEEVAASRPAGAALMGMMEEVYCLPLVSIGPENRAKLEKALAAQGLLQAQKV